MKNFISILILSVLYGCIPVQRAPNIKDFKVMNAKKFDKTIAPKTTFIFKDPKDADEFYNYINTKFQLKHDNVGYNSPVVVDGVELYLTYYEKEKLNTTLNLPLVIIDKKLEQEDIGPLFENNYTKRTGEWYLMITVYDENLKNCLLKSHPLRPKVLKFLKELKDEYLNTHNYESLLFLEASKNGVN